jgi:hypothetical protein
MRLNRRSVEEIIGRITRDDKESERKGKQSERTKEMQI